MAMRSDTVWEGRIGSTQLRVDVPFAGRIFAEWQTPNGARNKSVSSLEELERSVLFQLILSGGEKDLATAQEILAAVAEAEASKPRAKQESETPKRRKNPKARRHRRSRTPPRRY